MSRTDYIGECEKSTGYLITAVNFGNIAWQKRCFRVVPGLTSGHFSGICIGVAINAQMTAGIVCADIDAGDASAEGSLVFILCCF